MEFDSMHLWGLQSLQGDGIPSREILSPSSIEDICSLRKSPKCPHCIASERTFLGMMLYLFGEQTTVTNNRGFILLRLLGVRNLPAKLIED